MQHIHCTSAIAASDKVQQAVNRHHDKLIRALTRSGGLSCLELLVLMQQQL